MSQRIPMQEEENMDKSAVQMLGAVKGSLGSVPNMFQTMAVSPVALEAYLATSAALSKGKLSAQLREQIAIGVAGYNVCDYCASAHIFLGDKAGISSHELSRNLRMESVDAATTAVLDFVHQLLERRGGVADSALDDLRVHGFTDEHIVEIVAHVGMNVFTNYFNRVADTEVDFPQVSAAAQ